MDEFLEYASGVEDVQVGSPDDPHGEVEYGDVLVEINRPEHGRMARIVIPSGGLAQMDRDQLREFIAAAQGALDILDDDQNW